MSYITQRGAETFFLKEGFDFAKNRIKYYIGNAEILKTALIKSGIKSVSGNSSPYVFSKCPNGLSSEEFSEKLLNTLGIMVTSGSGFGKSGEGYFRLSAFPSREEILEATDILTDKLDLVFN